MDEASLSEAAFVGAGLLAKASGQTLQRRMTHRIRQQAGSHGHRPESDYITPSYLRLAMM
jgi:hypothetical protein